MIAEKSIGEVGGLVGQLYRDAKKWVIGQEAQKLGHSTLYYSSTNGHRERHRARETSVLFYQVKQQVARCLRFYFVSFYLQSPLKSRSQQYMYILVFLKLNVLAIRNEKFPWHSKTYWSGVKCVCFPEIPGYSVLMDNFVVSYLFSSCFRTSFPLYDLKRCLHSILCILSCHTLPPYVPQWCLWIGCRFYQV